MSRARVVISVPGPMPSLNDLEAARGRVRRLCGGKRANAYNDLKRSWMGRICLLCDAHKLAQQAGEGPCTVALTAYEPDRRRDPDNVLAGARKIILDALQQAGVIAGDGWRHIAPPFVERWDVDARNPRVDAELTWPEKK